MFQAGTDPYEAQWGNVSIVCLFIHVLIWRKKSPELKEKTFHMNSLSIIIKHHRHLMFTCPAQEQLTLKLRSDRYGIFGADANTNIRK